MIKRALLILLMSAGVSLGAGSSPWHNMITDGTNYATVFGGATNIISDIVIPADFCMTISGEPEVLASSYDAVGGGLVSGTITNTWTVDESYLIFNESSRPDIRFTHTNLTADIITILWVGYYDGNPAHTWSVEMWDYTTSSWDVLNADALPDIGGTDYSVVIPIPEPQTNYVLNGVATQRWYHSASIVGGNTIGFDYLSIVQAQVNIETAGVWYSVGDLANCTTPSRFNVNESEGTATNTLDGKYEWVIGGSGTGTPSTTFRWALFTNDVISSVKAWRTIDTGGSIGNAWAIGDESLPADTKSDVRMTSERENSHASFLDFKFKGKRINN